MNAYWLQNINHQGRSAYNSNPDAYQVFRNIKDFGAVGDGFADDTAAINNAISSGGRCGGGTCGSSTVTPALVFFPQGTYRISSPIIAYYYTQLVGDAKSPPTLLASPDFVGIAVIDADPYIPGGGGAQWYQNTNNFYRSVRNFLIDLRQVPASATATGLHWQVSQATSLFNVVVEMNDGDDTRHQGIFMENGSGGLMSDLVFNGGRFGMWVGNQQFTVRNLTVNNAKTAVFATWNWGWTFQRVSINNCRIGFELTMGGPGGDSPVGAEAILDTVVTSTLIFVQTSAASGGALAGSIVLNNVTLFNVPIAVGVKDGATVLPGGNVTIASWGQGNIYAGVNPAGSYVQGDIHDFSKPASLLDDSGRIFVKPHPQYADLSLDQIVSARDFGALGDGHTDDTAALQNLFNQFSGTHLIFLDAGTYIVTSTLMVPAGTQLIGEAWSVIAGRGDAFANQDDPQVVVRVGEVGSMGVTEISDVVFTTIGPAAGAIVIEWNVRDPDGQKGAAGMWDTHVRLGGAAGTNLQRNCSSGANDPGCIAAFLALHLTPQSSAYLEGTWVWLADHDLDGDSQITIFSARGILSESQGPVWMIGTSEHHTLYQYNIVNARDHYMGLIQTETPYYQPSPPPPDPFRINPAYNDPTFDGMTAAWGLRIRNSHDIVVFGAGLYSFFQNYSSSCIASRSCQAQTVDLDDDSTVSIYSLATVATTFQISVNGQGIVDQGNNVNGFSSTVTLWRSSNT